MYLGLDIGTTNIKAVVLDGCGKVLAITRLPTPRREQLDAAVKYAEISPPDLMAALVRVIRDLPGGLRENIQAIGVAGQMHGMLFMDSAGKPLSNFITWQDTRVVLDARRGSDSMLSRAMATLKTLRRITGCDMRPGMAALLLPWMMDNQALPPQDDWRVGFLPDFIVSQIVGDSVPTDATNAAASGLFDIQSLDWAGAYIEAVGIERKRLPSVAGVGAIVGNVTELAAGQYGLPAGVPVCAGIGDFQAAMLGIDLHEREMALNVGTGAQVAALNKAPHCDVGFETRPFLPGCFLLCLPGLPGGARLDGLSGQGDGAGASPVYVEIIESMLGAYLQAFQKLKKQVPDAVACVKISGGILRDNELLLQMLEQKLDVPLVRSDYAEEAAVGAALLAARGPVRHPCRQGGVLCH